MEQPQQQTILIVDDVPEVRRMLHHLLSEEGYNILQAENGVEAMDIINSNTIDLLITDILMPEMNGTELANAAAEVNPDLKMIAMSGGGKPYDVISMCKKMTGVTHVLRKPFKLDEMLLLVQELLEPNG